jgi:tetratricopeptide (TPR) repeat protein
MLKLTVHKRWERCSAAKQNVVARLLAQTVLVWALQLSSAWAGGGPETTLVIVNGASPVSLEIANAYVRMRDIPESHVVWLNDVPTADSIDIKTFRARVWKPIRDYITTHHLDEEIDTIAYSADFPYRVDFKTDLKAKKITNNPYRGTFASLTGLTYFARRVERNDIGYVGENFYFRRDLAPQVIPPRVPSPDELRLIKEALKSVEHKDYKSAVESLQSVVKSYPWSANAWFHLARGLAALGQSDDALHALSKAVDMGWPNSLLVRNDKLLKPLSNYPGFSRLIHQMQLKTGPFQAAHGFRNQYVWTGRAAPVIQTGGTNSPDRYYLSTLLAYTGLRGNSMPEVLNYLRSAVASDGAVPDGTVYLMENSDVRSQTREASFYATAAALTRRGRRVEILQQGRDGQDGIIPRNKPDVIGAVVGTRRFNWGRSNSRLLPGAIAESLTSYGGAFTNGAQTKLSEFLRYGAAGSSGAVAEPYSLQAKFPVPYLHVHYADGSSLAEAFYQSIEAPYQLIVVGDPLARPFAYFADVKLASPATAQPWHDAVLLKPKITPAKGHAIHRVELWVDGQYIDQVAPWDVFVWNTRTVEDGCHDLRLVAVEDSPMETRSYVRLAVTVNNHHHRFAVNSINKRVTAGDDLVLSGAAPDGQRVELFQGARLLGKARVHDGRWTVHVASGSLGLGKVLLYARAYYANGSTARSCGTVAAIEPPPRLPATGKPDGNYRQGLAVRSRDHGDGDEPRVIKRLNGRLKELGNDGDADLRFNGEFNVTKPGFYQLAFATRGRLRVKIDGRLETDHEFSGEDDGVYIPLNLGSGWHSLAMELVAKGRPFLRARLGGEQVTVPLAGRRLRHGVAP